MGGLAETDYANIITSITASVITLVGMYFAFKTKMKELDDKIDANTKETVKNADTLVTVAQNVQKIETHTNSMTEKLVTLTGEKEFARGQLVEGDRASDAAKVEAVTKAAAIVEEQARVQLTKPRGHEEPVPVETRTEAAQEKGD